MTVLFPFPLTPISCEAGCSASHKQSFFQHQNVLWPGFGSFTYSRCSKVARSHFTGLGEEHEDEEIRMPQGCSSCLGSMAAVDNWEPSAPQLLTTSHGCLEPQSTVAGHVDQPLHLPQPRG